MLHAGGVYHRDIAPDNIIVLDDGGLPVLLDFGAARRVIGDGPQALTAILKPSFAPIEQYAEAGTALRQGPWTDIYALAAVMRFMLTGNAPLPATTRVVQDATAPLAALLPADCSSVLLGAIDWALAVRPQDRPQSIAAWRDALDGRIAPPARASADDIARTSEAVADRDDPSWTPTLVQAASAAAAEGPPSRSWRWPLLIALASAAAVALVVFIATDRLPPAERAAAPQPAPVVPTLPRAPPVDAIPQGAVNGGKAGRAEAAPASPREACGDRVLLALVRCMTRECEQPRFQSHPQCIKLREEAARRRERFETP